MQLFALVLFYIVFTELFVALTLYLILTIRNYLTEEKKAKAAQEEDLSHDR